MTATFLTDLTALAATSPVSLVGTGVVCGCSTLFLVTRIPEFFVMTMTAGVYTAIAMLPLVHA